MQASHSTIGKPWEGVSLISTLAYTVTPSYQFTFTQTEGEYVNYKKKLMHCHCGTNNRARRWTFTDPCKPEVRPGAQEEEASPAWLAAPAMNMGQINTQIIF